jgi:hypothetical protein
MSHSMPRASTCATYLVSDPRRLTLTCAQAGRKQEGEKERDRRGKGGQDGD